MTLRHIRIFLSVYDNDCNTTKAAANLHMTQPAVSLAIRELEQYYGVILFDRIGRRLKITEVGKQFLDYASRIILLFDDMEKRLRDWDSSGLLRVGASITIGSQFLPGYVKQFYDRYPETEVKVLVAPSDQLEQKILNNELDFALIEGIAHAPSLAVEEFMEDRLIVVCPANDFFSQKKRLTIDEFLSQKFLLREHGSGTREVFDRTIESAGFSVSPTWEATSTAALVNAVISGLGIAVLPYRMVIDSINRGLITSVEVDGLSFHRKFHIIYHKEKFLTAAAKAFLNLCRSETTSLSSK